MAISNKVPNLDKLNPGYNPVVYAFDSTNKTELGFRYIVEVGYDIYTYGTQNDINSYTNNSGNVRLNLNSVHGLVPGDKLEIFQATAAYNGIWTVLSVQSSTALTVDIVWSGAGILGAEYIKPLTITEDKIFEGRVAPRPSDGYGYIDLSKILSNYVTYDLPTLGPGSDDAIEAVNSFFEYTVRIGEEYIVNWNFDDSIFNGGLTQTSVQQSPSVTPHTFVVGDQVNVSCTNPNLFPPLEGLHTVGEVVSAYEIAFVLPFQSTATNPGVVSYADNRKSVFRDLFTYSNNVISNSAVSFKDYTTWDESNYKLSSTASKLFSSLDPDKEFYVRPTQDIHLNFTSDYYVDQIQFTDDQGNITTSSSAYLPEKDFVQVPVGPNNNGFSIVGATTSYYDVQLLHGGYGVCAPYRFKIDRRCPIEDYEILFQDRMGSFLSIAFPLRSNNKGKIKRETYNKQIGDFTDGRWNYDVWDNGMNVTNVTVEEELTLRTDWFMSQYMQDMFIELVTSPVTFVKIDGEYYSCIIQDSNYDKRSPNYKKLKYGEVKIMLSNQNIINI
jgi:hypothetical protein